MRAREERESDRGDEAEADRHERERGSDQEKLGHEGDEQEAGAHEHDPEDQQRAQALRAPYAPGGEDGSPCREAEPARKNEAAAASRPRTSSA